MKTNHSKGLFKNCFILFVVLIAGFCALPDMAFAAKTLTINITGLGTVAYSNQNNTISGSITTSGTVSFGNNDVVTCTLTPNAGYVLTTPATSPATVTMGNSAQTLNVIFTQQRTLAVTVSGNGTVACSGGYTLTSTGSASASFIYLNNANAVCDLVPDAGFALTTPATTPQTIAMTSNKSLNVTFTGTVVNKILVVNITGTGTVACHNISGGSTTSLSSTGNITYASTDTVVCDMTAGTNYALTAPASSPATIAMAGNNQTLNVTFSSTVITDITVNGTVSPSGGGSIRADNAATGEIIVAQGSASGSSGLIAANVAHTYYIIPVAPYGISRLVYDGVDVTSSLSCPSGIDATCSYTAANVGATNHTIAATFDTVYTITANSSTTGCGGANGGAISPATLKVARGQTATFNVVLNAGYALKQINYNGSADMATAQYAAYTYVKTNIQANGTVEAVFTPVFTITSSWSGINGATGTISPLSATVICGGNSSPFAIAATPPAIISNVLAGGVSQGAVNSYQFNNVTANNTISAIFELTTSQINSYTITPPFVQAAILPNLLLLLDNSASMYDLAYDPSGQCLDSTYNNAESADYAGYFDSGATYSYNTDTNKFVPGATLPNGCTFRTADFCVNLTGTKPNRTVTDFIAKGKFLNWLSASKLDLQKKILTGGKYDTGNSVLIGESRGCMGRRFVKLVPNTQASASTENLEGLSFAIRGPGSADIDYVNPATQGGPTRIEIFDAAYNTGSCTAALIDWQNVTEIQMGQLQNDTRDCIACTSDSCNSARTLKGEAYIHIIHNCYWYYNNHSFSNTNTLTNDCDNIYSNIYANNPALIISDLAGDAICSSVLYHPFINGNDTGYLGKCVSIGTGAAGKNEWNDTCLNTEMTDFCAGIAATDVTDPSGTGVTTGSSTSIPSFVIDAGVNALGAVTGTFFVNVSLSTPPTGLIEQFKNYINFGAMVFNTDGSGTECDVIGNNITCAKHCSITTTKACYASGDCPSGESCTLNTKTDGGKIISYLGYDVVGNHSSGLIKSVDDIQAGSWTPFAEAFYNAIGYFSNRTALRLQTADFDASKPPPSETCRLNNILLISDGGSTADRQASVSALAGLYNDGTVNSHGTCPSYAGSKDASALAWLAKNRNIRNFVIDGGSTTAPVQNNESITTYSVYSGPTTASTDPCIPKNLMNSIAVNGGTSLYQASTYNALLQSLEDAFARIASSSASGTAASILNNSEGSGASLLQAVFYPKKIFEKNDADVDTYVNWIGELQNLWYYIDPFFNRSTIREDTDQNFTLDLKADYSARFRFDSTSNQTMVDLYQDTLGNGSAYTSKGTVSPDNVKSLWKAGRQLWARDLSDRPRRIYTVTDSVLRPFTTTDFTGDSVWPLLQTSDATTTTHVINYIHGIDNQGELTRNRTVRIGGVDNTWKLGDIVNSTPKILANSGMNNYQLQPPNGYGDSTYKSYVSSSPSTSHGMVFVGGNDGMLHAFRLGLLNVSTQTTTQKAKMYDSNGTLATAVSELGEEVWAFIPKNTLPYLKYFGDPDYAHLFYVDNTVSLIDASIGVPADNDDVKFPGCDAANYYKCGKKSSSWRSVLLGGMGFGGASRNKIDSLGVAETCSQCVKTPVNGLGYSSYFALDVTNPEARPDDDPVPADPFKYLWEFNAAGAVGFSTSGPAVVRVGSKDTNGRWLAVFGSGSTGPINTVTHSFMGESDQSLKLFVVDIATGEVVQTITKYGIDNAGADLPSNAFVGSLSNAVIDADKWNSSSTGHYSDDAIYVGYVRMCTVSDIGCTTGTFTKGGVIRILTKENTDPDLWEVSPVIENIGPVTTAVTKLQDRRAKYDPTKSNAASGKLWLFFGTGRFFFKEDDKDDSLRLYGIEEPCYSMNSGSPLFTPTGPTNDFPSGSCTTTVTESQLQNQTGTASDAPSPNLALNKRGWFLNLITSAADDGYYSERVITNPVATPSGAVFFTTFRPSANICSFLGNSYIWALRYDTGAAPPASAMQGRALLQVSTGEIAEIALSIAFKQSGESIDQRFEDRRTNSPITGMPPTAQGLALMINPTPTKKIMHIQEK